MSNSQDRVPSERTLYWGEGEGNGRSRQEHAKSWRVGVSRGVGGETFDQA